VTIDICFGIDIILNFRTTLINPMTNLEIIEPVKIASYYLQSSKFWIDFVSAIPFEMIVDMLISE
jgi:hypothetical protein